MNICMRYEVVLLVQRVNWPGKLSGKCVGRRDFYERVLRTRSGIGGFRLCLIDSTLYPTGMTVVTAVNRRFSTKY